MLSVVSEGKKIKKKRKKVIKGIKRKKENEKRKKRKKAIKGIKRKKENEKRKKRKRKR